MAPSTRDEHTAPDDTGPNDTVPTDTAPNDTADDTGLGNRSAARKGQGSPAQRQTLTNRLYTGEISYDFVGRRKRWAIITAVVVGLSLLAVLVRGLSLGIEFKGGADFQAPTQVTSQTVDDMRAAVVDSGVPDLGETTVTTMGENTVRVQTRSLDAQTEVPQLRSAIAEQVGVNPDEVAYSLIGASWGEQITKQGLIALGVFLVLVMGMIWVYFRDLKMSIAAIAALLHDLVLTIGVYALVGFTFTPASLIGLLTILGYSLYDTVVVFDKVRENVKGLTSTRKTYAEQANLAVNQVLVRSINTTIIGVLPVAALLIAGWVFLGTGPLKDLGLVLFVGMVAGAYSSILIATPLLVEMKVREPAMRAHEAALRRRAARKRPREDAEGSRTARAGAQERRSVRPAIDEVDRAAETGGDDGESGSTGSRPVVRVEGARRQPRHQSRSERKN